MDGAFAVFLGTFALMALAMGIAKREFARWRFLDFPERYGLKRKRLPYPSGIVAVAVFSLIFVSTQPLHFQNLGVLGAVLLLALVCFLDDRTPVSPFVRLATQCLVGSLVFLTGTRIFSITNPFALWTGIQVLPLDRCIIVSESFSNPSIVGGIFTVFWLCLTMNAMNWLDGIPGQVDAHASIGFLVIGLLAFSERVGQPHVGMLAFLLAGISVAGLLFHFPPPTMILGDTGAMFYGLLLGILTIYAGGKLATAFLVLGIPIVDCIVVIIRRMIRKKSPFQSTPEHLHHLLLQRGWSAQKIICLTTAIGTLFGVTALFLSTTAKAAAVLLLISLVAAISVWAKRPVSTT